MKKAFTISIAILGLFFAFQVSALATINFENAPEDTIYDWAGFMWAGGSATDTTWHGTSSTAYAGNKSLYGTYVAGKYLNNYYGPTIATSGEASFWAKATETAHNGYDSITFTIGNASNSNPALNGCISFTHNIAYDEQWHEYKIVWDMPNATDSCYYDGIKHACSDTYNGLYPWERNCENINYLLQIALPVDSDFTNIDEYQWLDTGTYYAGDGLAQIYPDWPTDCDFTPVPPANNNGTAEGLVFIPGNSPYQWETLFMYWQEINGDDHYVLPFDLNDITATGTQLYIPYTIDFAVSTSTWKIFYQVVGLNTTTNQTASVVKDYNDGCETTFGTPTSTAFYFNCTPEDCSGYAWWDSMERIYCEGANLGLSVLCPSSEAQTKVKTIITDINSRFPISYITAIKNEFSSTTENMGTSTAGTSTYAMVNMDGVDKLGQIGVFSTIRTLLSFIMIFITIIWIIRYTATEFFT